MKKLGIIGTGISAMGAAYLLRDRFEITFYEKNEYVGGHTNTVTVDEQGAPVHIDSGFMVYNERTYPLLTRLFKELDIQTKPTDMSFSFQHIPSALEYSGSGLNGLFAQRRNIFNPGHVRMLLDISRFRNEAVEVLNDPKYQGYSLAQYVQEKNYCDDFLKKFLIPMSSAVWSTPFDVMMDFPAATLVRFFKNHCFLDLQGQPQWRTCEGGSRQYRDKIMKVINAKVLMNTAARQVRRAGDHVEVTDAQGNKTLFDKVLLAAHADESLALLLDATDLERKLLSQFAYHANRVILHTDTRVMPRLKRAWSSWNYRVGLDKNVTTIYWMNSLQGVSPRQDYFVSINDPGIVDPKSILWERMYTHPIYTVASQEAQANLPRLNENDRVFFSGAYFRYGFHEDGLLSALQAARAISGENLWS